MASDTPHTMHVILTNRANANQLWGVLWSAKEPGNGANSQTFTNENAYKDITSPGPGPDAWIINSPCTIDQKAELENFFAGGTPQRWLDDGLSQGQLNTWRSEMVKLAFDVNHLDFVLSTNYRPVTLP